MYIEVPEQAREMFIGIGKAMGDTKYPSDTVPQKPWGERDNPEYTITQDDIDRAKADTARNREEAELKHGVECVLLSFYSEKITKVVSAIGSGRR